MICMGARKWARQTLNKHLFWFIKLSTFIQMKKVEILKVFGSDQEVLVSFIFKEKTVLFSLISLLSRNEKS